MPGPFVHNIDPIIGQIGGMYLWWYGLSYTLGFLGLFHWLRSVRQYLYMDVRDVYSLSIAVAAGVLVGGRLVEVIFYEWAYYSAHPWHIFWIWLGGMSTHGILLGATLGLIWYSRRHQRSFLELADELVIPAALIMGLGRLGNFIDGQIVGSVTDVWWAVKFPDVEGYRHPVVLYDGLKNLLLIPALFLIRYMHPPRGVMLGAFLLGYGFFRIFIDFFREYRTDFFGLPPGQEFNLGMTVVGISLIVWAYRRGQIGVKPLNITILSGGPEMDVRKATRFKRMIFRLLLIIPLVIPSDWTQDIPEKYGERHHGLTHSNYYPIMQSSPYSETP
ncbi:MAG: prolipoprotein diacylglyceryl transferase [Gammaproteobacteria bacterium]|nr:prolipoprotein diacylglyceryl transferase [Gammaproteobacteria bacterium]